MTQAVEITFLRHGRPQQSELLLGRTDPDLSDIGFQQCQQALAQQSFDRIISSPLKRCQQFAAKFADQHQLPLQLDSNFIELDFGDWDGLPLTELWQLDGGEFARYWENPFAVNPPNGEQTNHLRARVVGATEKLVDGGAQRILVVCHGGVLRVLLSWLFDVDAGNAHLSRVVAGHASQLKLSLYRDEAGLLWPQLCGLIPAPEL